VAGAVIGIWRNQWRQYGGWRVAGAYLAWRMACRLSAYGGGIGNRNGVAYSNAWQWRGVMSAAAGVSM